MKSHKSTIDGTAFVAHLGPRQIGIYLPNKERSVVVRTSDVKEVSTQRNGHTKLSIRLRKDLIIPTTRSESLVLIEALSPLLSKAQEAETKKEKESKIRRQEERLVKLVKRSS